MKMSHPVVGLRRSRAGLSNSPAMLKEPAVRAGFLAGMTIVRLAETFGVMDHVMHDYVYARCEQWRASAKRGIREDERRVVVFARQGGEFGGYDVRPISLPRITMHVKALDERAGRAA